MTREEFFSEYAQDCCDSVDRDIEEVFVGIIEGLELNEEELFDELIDNYSEVAYSVLTVNHMITDSSLSIGEVLENADMEELLSVKAIQNMYKKHTNEDVDLMELWEEEEKTVLENLENAFVSTGIAKDTPIDELEKIKDIILEVYEQYCDLVYAVSASKKNADDEELYYVLVSDGIYFDV